jgi:hypothetical protein
MRSYATRLTCSSHAGEARAPRVLLRVWDAAPALAQVLEFPCKGLKLLVIELLQVDQLRSCAACAAYQFIKLELERLRVSVLGVCRRNAMRKVSCEAAVFIVSCHVSEKSNSGPSTSQMAVAITVATNIQGDPAIDAVASDTRLKRFFIPGAYSKVSDARWRWPTGAVGDPVRVAVAGVELEGHLEFVEFSTLHMRIGRRLF